MEDTLAELSFGDWLKRRRKAAGLTQEQLALQISCSTSALKKIEAEERRPSAQIVERLAGIFNIPPNELTKFLRFARGDLKSAPSIESEDAPWRASIVSPRSNLPASLNSLIGRNSDIAVVREYLSNVNTRLITLIGPPGIGKTRLSLEVTREVLHDFRDGTFFVALAPVEDSSLVASIIVQTLGFAETELKSPLERLKDGIGHKHMLLVLDNLEHLIEDAASVVSDLLLACPHLKILTTSREALRAPGEWLYSVPALNMPAETQLQSIDMQQGSQYAALSLFAERARAVRSDFALDADNIQTVAAICTQLDGLPLAIELIAARIRLMSPQTLLAKLNDEFVLSSDGMRAVPARQKTLHNAIRWSYNLLSAVEQNLFVRLSVFSGSFTLDAAEAVFSRTITNKSVFDLVVLLLDKSLLQRTLGVRGEPRFNMLVTIQQFAMDHLRHRQEETEARNWHLAYFLDLAEQADKEIHGPDQAEWMERLDIEHDNFRAALEWSISGQKTELSLRLFGALSWFRRLRGFLDEARIGFHRIRGLPDVALFPLQYAKVLNAMGRTEWLLGDYSDAKLLLNESVEIWHSLESEQQKGLAEALDFLGMVARNGEGNNKQAQLLLEQGMELYRKNNDRRGLAESLFHIGLITFDRNDDTLALSWFEQSLSLFRQLDDLWGIARVSQMIGEQYLKRGKYEQARLCFEEQLKLDERIQFWQGMTHAFIGLGDSYRHQGNYDHAEQFYKDALSVARKYSIKEEQAGAVLGLGFVALYRSDYLLAEQYFRDYYNIRRHFHKIWPVIDFLDGLAAVAAGCNQFERAAKLHGAAQALFSSFNLPDISYDRVESDNLIQMAREQFGEERFEVLAAEGRAMTVEQAVAYALEE